MNFDIDGFLYKRGYRQCDDGTWLGSDGYYVDAKELLKEFIDELEGKDWNEDRIRGDW